MSIDKFNFILYADDTTLNAAVESFGETAADIQLSISNELHKICKWLDLNKLHLNVAKYKFMLFHMPQKVIPQLHFSLNGSPLHYVTEFIFLGLTLDCNLNLKSHLKSIGSKVSRVIGMLHKLKYIFPAYLLRMIYNSLILPHINYCLLAWGSNCSVLSYYKKKNCSSCQL